MPKTHEIKITLSDAMMTRFVSQFGKSDAETFLRVVHQGIAQSEMNSYQSEVDDWVKHEREKKIAEKAEALKKEFGLL